MRGRGLAGRPRPSGRTVRQPRGKERSDTGVPRESVERPCRDGWICV